MGFFFELFLFVVYVKDVDCRFVWDNGYIIFNSLFLVIFFSVVYFLKFYKYFLLEKEIF